jgi:transcriptional regulator with XRE-family HTH domain
MHPLKSYREENELSQQQLADRLGISRQMVGMLETGERDCTADMCLLIEKKLGIPREEILPELFIRKNGREYKLA